MYGWGRGEHGRLGFGDDKSSKMVPQRVQLLVGEDKVQVLTCVSILMILILKNCNGLNKNVTNELLVQRSIQDQQYCVTACVWWCKNTLTYVLMVA